jgi:hypothetical protein
MNDLPSDIQARRAIEDRAVQLGAERRRLNDGIEANTQAILQLLRNAEGTGVPHDYLAHLTGVSRQTLYRWREDAGRLKPTDTAAEVAESNKR